MSEHTFRFMINQADPGVVFTATNDDQAPVSPGHLAGWSSPSYKLNDNLRLDELEPDNGHWVGDVHMLPDDIANMTATYFPEKGAIDNVQLAGPILMDASESAIAIVGGGGRFAGAKGQARCVVAMSDQGTPLYRYELKFSV